MAGERLGLWLEPSAPSLQCGVGGEKKRDNSTSRDGERKTLE